uniref:Transposase n=1 Tax=Ascaris lumbricoides TaxID=6252 RepID=A0A0M3HN91_ASCLU
MLTVHFSRLIKDAIIRLMTIALFFESIKKARIHNKITLAIKLI